VPFGSAHLPPDRIGAVNQVSTAVQAEAFTGEALSWTAPVFLESPSKSAVAQPRSSPEVSRRFRVLIADDNADMREYLSNILAPEYDVTTVPDGGAALQEARREPPDLILSDVMMPHLDGFALLRAVRVDPVTATIPIILLSARAGEESKVQGMEAGADDYLSKPFSARELLARVRAQIEMASLRKRMEDRLRAHTEALCELMQSLATALRMTIRSAGPFIAPSMATPLCRLDTVFRPSRRFTSS
jgi:PleD family two-component response regulator